MQTLSSIPGYEDKLPQYTERETIEPFIQSYLIENEYDDLSMAETTLQDFLNDPQSGNKNKADLVAELDSFRRILNEVKLAYTELANPKTKRYTYSAIFEFWILIHDCPVAEQGRIQNFS